MEKQKWYYFKSTPEEQYEADGIASYLMEDNELWENYLNENFTAASLFWRITKTCNASCAIEDIKNEIREAIAKRVETDENFRKFYEIEYIEE